MASINSGHCTAVTCPVPSGFLLSPPSLEGSAFMAAAFGVLVPINFAIAIRYKTLLYSSILTTGLLLEVMGYVGRILLRSDLASRAYFLTFLLGTVLGSTFISAAVYLVLPHVLVLYGKDVSVVRRPLYLGFLFLAFDVFTLAFQVVGILFAVYGSTAGEMSQGLNILLAGLGLQLASLVVFFGLLYWFLIRLTSNRHLLDPRHSDIYFSARFKIFLLCIQIATLFILIRTISRTIQLAPGLSSVLAQSQIVTMVLDGAEVLFASIILTLPSPGAAFGATAWAQTSPYKRAARRPSSLPLQYQRGPYAQSFKSPNSYGVSPNAYYVGPRGGPLQQYGHGQHTPQQQLLQQQQQQQIPAHWQEPGVKRPDFSKYVPPYRSRKPGPGAFEITPPQQGEAPLPVSELSPRSVRSAGETIKENKEKKKVAPERSDVVDPDALWD